MAGVDKNRPGCLGPPPVSWKSDKDHWQSTTIHHQSATSGWNPPVGDEFLISKNDRIFVAMLNRHKSPFRDEYGIQAKTPQYHPRLCGRGYPVRLNLNVWNPHLTGHKKKKKQSPQLCWFYRSTLRCYQGWRIIIQSSIDFDVFLGELSFMATSRLSQPRLMTPVGIILKHFINNHQYSMK